MTVDYVCTQICQMYINIYADGTWAKELAEVSQIIALITLVKINQYQDQQQYCSCYIHFQTKR